MEKYGHRSLKTKDKGPPLLSLIYSLRSPSSSPCCLLLSDLHVVLEGLIAKFM